MQSSSPIRLVVFDLGRVLIRICDSWQHACEVASRPGALPEADPIQRAVMHELVQLVEIGAITQEIFCQRVGRLFGANPDDIHAISEAYLRGPFEGADKLIDDLHDHGVQTACLSNTNANHWRMMTTLGSPNVLPLEKLTYQFASHLTGLRKPDAAIFNHVERHTGWGPENIILFDDAAENIDAARRQGWDGVLITDREAPLLQVRTALLERKVLTN